MYGLKQIRPGYFALTYTPRFINGAPEAYLVNKEGAREVFWYLASQLSLA